MSVRKILLGALCAISLNAFASQVDVKVHQELYGDTLGYDGGWVGVKEGIQAIRAN